MTKSPVDGRWYMVSAAGIVTACADERDARREAEEADILWPRSAPHRAMRLTDATEAEVLRIQLDELRGCLLWLLYYHQGARSQVGQPIRRALGLRRHERMTKAEIDQAKRFGGAMADSLTPSA